MRNEAIYLWIELFPVAMFFDDGLRNASTAVTRQTRARKAAFLRQKSQRSFSFELFVDCVENLSWRFANTAKGFGHEASITSNEFHVETVASHFC